MWTTEKEIAFISKMDKEKLTAYLQSLEKREKWENLNKDEILQFARLRQECLK